MGSGPGEENALAQSRKVLVVGLEPRAVPGVDADLVGAALQAGQARFRAEGIEADLCLVGLSEEAEGQIVGQLKSKDYACVVVGGGIRKPEPLLEFFETVINLIRRHAPDAAIAFNTNPRTASRRRSDGCRPGRRKPCSGWPHGVRASPSWLAR